MFQYLIHKQEQGDMIWSFNVLIIWLEKISSAESPKYRRNYQVTKTMFRKSKKTIWNYLELSVLLTYFHVNISFLYPLKMPKI